MIPFLFAAIVTTPSHLPAPRIAAVEFVVRDIDAKRRFYTDALGFTSLGGGRADDGERIERLALGHERLILIRPPENGRAVPAGAKSDDRDFQHIAIIVSDMTRAWNRVRRYAIRPVSLAPQVLPAWNPSAGGIAAVSFRDPEGHPLELLHFPLGKGVEGGCLARDPDGHLVEIRSPQVALI